MDFGAADCSYKNREEIISRKCVVEHNMEGKVIQCITWALCRVSKAILFQMDCVCVLCLCVHKPCGRCGNSVTPVSVNLCFRLWPLIGQSLVAVLTETEDGQHVSPLLPPQRVSFVQRGELTGRGERGSMSHIASHPVQSSCGSTPATSVRIVIEFISALDAGCLFALLLVHLQFERC